MQVAQRAVGVDRRVVGVRLVRPVLAPLAVDLGDLRGDRVGAASGTGNQLAHLGDDRLEHQRGVANDALGDFDLVVEVFGVERRVDVVRTLGHLQAEAGLGEGATDAEDDVGVSQELVHRLGEGAAAGAERERVRLGEGALALQRGGDRRLEQLGQLPELVPGPGVVDALAGVDHGALGVDQRLRGLARVCRIGTGAVGGRRRVVDRFIDLRAPEVAGDLQHNRPLAAVLGVGEGAAHGVGQVVGVGQLLGPLAHVLEVDQTREVGATLVCARA